jgi:opacity protein-like surface antigen
MKKIIFTAIMIAALGAAAFARDKAPAMERKTLSGTLVIEYGQIALKTEDGLYYVRGLGQLAGFVDGLKEGAAVTLQGTVRASERKRQNIRPEPEGQKAQIASRNGDSQGSFREIRAEKLSLNGKDYDLLQFPNIHGPKGFMSGRSPDRRHMNDMHGSRGPRERRMTPRRW